MQFLSCSLWRRMGGAGNVPSYSWESRSLFNQGKVVSDEEGVRY